MAYTIGIDTGGTFTDAVLIDGTEPTASAKAATTPGDLTIGLLASLRELAARTGQDLRALLGQTRTVRFSGTTATNALLTYRGAPPGVLTTRGFEDTLAIGRSISAWAGLTEEQIRHAYWQQKPPPLAPRRLIRGVTGRIDWSGSELVPLDEAELGRAVAALAGEGVSSVAICFLWSIRNGAHERRARELVESRFPHLSVHCSADVAPTVGEYERFATTVADAYVGPLLGGFLDGLEQVLRDEGFAGQLLVAQADGGCLYPSETQPVMTLQSGPAGGVIASAQEAADLGFENVITTDVGGTSFDVSLVADGAWIPAREPVLGRFKLSVPMIEVESVGAGGGSIAWVDELGALHVGPRSAGASPGPAAYGAGGEEPTVTDADVVLGYLNPGYFLGGSMPLRRDLAERAVDRIADRLGLSRLEAAAGIFDIVNTHMAALIQRSVVARGYDPRRFAIVAYGGAGGMHCASYAAEAGVAEVVVPALASVFSAFGVATAPLRHRASAFAFAPMPMDARVFTEHLAQLEAHVAGRLARDGVPADLQRLVYAVEMRYGVQVHTVRLEIPRQRYDDAGVREVCRLFDEKYDRLFGRGSGYADAGRFLTSVAVEGYGSTALLERDGRGARPRPQEAEPLEAREAYFGGALTRAHVYRADQLAPGDVLRAPAIVEARETTVVVPPGAQARIDALHNLRIGGLSGDGR